LKPDALDRIVSISAGGLIRTHFWPDYGTSNADFLAAAPNFDCCSAIIWSANQKANGSRFGATSNAPMALTSSPDVAPQAFSKGHPRFFVREIRKGSSWKFQKLK
jgi:hypothetical protein